MSPGIWRDAESWRRAGGDSRPELSTGRGPGEADSERPDVKVLFIIGKGRSGSTLLDNALGQLDGFFSTGEVWGRWGGRPLSAYTCGCGEKLRSCDIWSDVLQAAYAEVARKLETTIDDDDVLRWERNVLRWPRIPRLLRTRPSTLSTWPALAKLARFSGALYKALARNTGGDVFIDSSKWPAAPGPLGLIPGIQSYVIHLVRDPRAVAYSWQKRQTFLPDGMEMPRFGSIHSATSWMARNLVAETVRKRFPDRSARIRYEDFVQNPRTILHRITELLGEQPASLPLRDQNTLLLDSNHTVWGNPSRFSTGEVEIYHDEKWRKKLDLRSHVSASILTLPLLKRYEYAMRS